MSSSFDLAALDGAATAEEGAVLELRHPNSGELIFTPDGKPVTIRLAGEDSFLYRRAQHTAQNRRFSRGALTKLRAEELENDQVEIYAACTLAWTGIALDGQDLPCTRQNALMVYKRFRWVVDQVADFIRDRANFLRSSANDSPSSSPTTTG